jgi:exonuclease SbcD
MPAFSFLHCADIHLGTPMKGVGKMPRALRDRLRDAPGLALARMVSAAIEHGVDAVLIAGDLYDAGDRNLAAQVRLRDELQRLDEAGIRTLITAGNHDPLGSLCRGVRLPDSVHLFDATPLPVVLTRDGEVLAHVYGASYPKSATYSNLAATFPRPHGPFNVAMLHTNVGDRPGFARYAPCSLEDLTSAGYDYWALGHVHTRETLSARTPVVHYPGNTQGLHTGEPGARGATLVEVADGGAVALTPVWTDVVRWHRARTSIDGMEAIEELVGAFGEVAGRLRSSAPDRMHIVRWTLTGTGPLHAEINRPGTIGELADALRSAEGIRSDGGVVWLEHIDLTTSPARDLERLRAQPDYLGDMLRLAAHIAERPPVTATTEIGDDRLRQTDEVGRAVRESLGELYDSARVARALGGDPWESLRWREIVSRAEALAVEHLAPQEAE